MEKVSKMKQLFTAKNLAYLAVLTALTIVLQIWGGAIKIGPTSISLVLVPIVLGAMLLGVSAGAFLGFVFGFIVLMYGVFGADPFTATLLNAHPFLTALLCLAKGTAAGAASGALYKLIVKKNKYVAVFVAAAAAPIVNTGLFILGGLCMSDMMSIFATQANYSNAVYFLFIGVAGWNFVVEFALNMLLSPVMFTVVKEAEKEINKKTSAHARRDEKTSEAYAEDQAREIDLNDNMS